MRKKERKNSMRILLITEFFPQNKKLVFTGGVEARTYFLAKYLSHKDKVIVISAKTAKEKQKNFLANVQIIPAGFLSCRVEANFFSLFSRLSFMVCAFLKGLKLDFDLVEGSNFVSYLPAYMLAKIKNKKAVAWYPDLFSFKWFKFFSLLGFFGLVAEKISLKLKWDKVIALSRETKKKLIKSGIKKNLIKVVYGGVEIANKKEKKLKEGNKIKNIICIARLVKYKRIDDLIAAFYILSKKNPFCRLIIVGKGPQKKNLQNLAYKLKVSKRIKFFHDISWRKKNILLQKEADVFCLPSEIEGFGLATLEAAAYGVPFVLSDIPIHREITFQGCGGLFFRLGDREKLAEQLQKLLKDKKLYRKKQKEAFGLAKRYSWSKIAEQTRKIYYEQT